MKLTRIIFCILTLISTAAFTPLKIHTPNACHDSNPFEKIQKESFCPTTDPGLFCNPDQNRLNQTFFDNQNLSNLPQIDLEKAFTGACYYRIARFNSKENLYKYFDYVPGGTAYFKKIDGKLYASMRISDGATQESLKKLTTKEIAESPNTKLDEYNSKVFSYDQGACLGYEIDSLSNTNYSFFKWSEELQALYVVHIFFNKYYFCELTPQEN